MNKIPANGNVDPIQKSWEWEPEPLVPGIPWGAVVEIWRLTIPVDDVGLGKTLQVVSAGNPEHTNETGAVLD